MKNLLFAKFPRIRMQGLLLAGWLALGLVNVSEAQSSAEEILKKAAKVQGGHQIAGKLKNFHARFETVYDGEKGKTSFSVERIFQFPELIWTKKWHDQTPITYEIYNGEDGWFVDDKGDKTVYTEDPASFKTDIENLEDDARLTGQMFKYFFIANLSAEITPLEKLDEGTVPICSGSSMQNKGGPALVVAGKTRAWIGGAEDTTVRLKIYIDPKNYLVKAVRMRDLTSDRKRLFLFDYYKLPSKEEFLRNEQGILVPTYVEMYSGDNPKYEMRISITGKSGKDGKRCSDIAFNIEDDITERFVLDQEEND